MSNAPADTVIPSLPTITGNGLFSVTPVVPNGSSSFNTPTGTTQANSYSYPLMEPANLIGTSTAPFMNVAIPAYITTLYNNVYNINNNLENSISTAATDDRSYPTSFAVQQYVQSQIAGTQLIDGNATNPNSNTYYVLTTVNNTLITNANPGTGFSYTYNGQNTPISLFWMDETPDTPRNGATKTVMFADKNELTDTNGVPTGKQAFIYAGDNSNFIHAGKAFKYYEFVYTGDFITFVQAYSATTNSWDWIITSCMGLFHKTVTLKNNANMSVTNANIKIPANGTFGGIPAPTPAPPTTPTV